jgi:hypothetical protein
MCLYPKLIDNPKYKATKKNGGIIPPINDIRVTKVPIGCGNCIECRKQKSREWQVRLNEEIRNNRNGKFVTLTFEEGELQKLKKEVIKTITPEELIENEIAKLGTRRFLERWRKKYKKSVKHWLITELGHNNTERIHIHGIIWTNEIEDIKKIWTYGHTYIGDYVNERTVNYIVKYVTKIDTDHKGYKAKILTSAGIGSNYIKRIDSNINKYKDKNTKEYYRTRTGLKLALPIYYRNKLYTEEEREKLWIEKLDKEERYILGEKISIKENEIQYEETLKRAQQKNKRLGFGDNSETWQMAHYKRMRNILKKNKN